MDNTIEKIKKRIEARKWKITDDAFVPELIGMQYANNMNDWCLEIIDEELAKEPQEQPIEQFTGLELANIAVALKRLQYYEDLAEKGLLVELPCKVGDTVYFIKSMFLYSKSPMRGMVCMLKTFSENCEFSFHVLMDVNNQGRVFTNSDIGKTVFLTESEAEQALADIK